MSSGSRTPPSWLYLLKVGLTMLTAWIKQLTNVNLIYYWQRRHSFNACNVLTSERKAHVACSVSCYFCFDIQQCGSWSCLPLVIPQWMHSHNFWYDTLPFMWAAETHIFHFNYHLFGALHTISLPSELPHLHEMRYTWEVNTIRLCCVHVNVVIYAQYKTKVLRFQEKALVPHDFILLNKGVQSRRQGRADCPHWSDVILWWRKSFHETWLTTRTWHTFKAGLVHSWSRGWTAHTTGDEIYCFVCNISLPTSVLFAMVIKEPERCCIWNTATPIY